MEKVKTRIWGGKDKSNGIFCDNLMAWGVYEQSNAWEDIVIFWNQYHEM